MDLPIRHVAFAGRRLLLRTAAFGRLRLHVDDVEVTPDARSNHRFERTWTVRDNGGLLREIRVAPGIIDPIPNVGLVTNPSSSYRRSRGTSTPGWACPRFFSPMSRPVRRMFCID